MGPRQRLPVQPPAVLSRASGFKLTAEVWRHAGDAGWHFVTLPEDLAEDIRGLAGGLHRPFGSLRVTASIGAVSWSTSLFADSRSGSYLLPLKAGVRRRAGVRAGDVVTVTFELDA